VLDAVVASVIFVGETHRYLLKLPDGQELVLKQPHRAGAERPAQGAPVRVWWQATDGRLVQAG
jgi:hypothetical protein